MVEKNNHPAKLNSFFALIPAFLFLVWSTNTIDTDIHIKFIAYAVLLIIAVIIILFNKNYDWNGRALYQPLFVLYSVYALYSAFNAAASPNFPDALFDWLKIFLNLVFFMLLAGFAEPVELMHKLSLAFTGIGFILFAGGLADIFHLVARGQIEIPLDTYSIRAMFGHRNVYAQALFFTLPFSGFCALCGKTKIARVLGACSFIFCLFMLVDLSHRTSWLAIGAGIIATSSTLIFLRIINKQPVFILPVSKLLVISSVVLLCSGLFYWKFSSVERLERHAASVTNFESGSTKDRLNLWLKTAKVIAEKPITGVGLSNWKFEVMKYGDEGLASQDHITFYARPENDFLWVCSEQGLIGLLLYAGLFVLTAYYLLKNIAVVQDKEEKVLRLALLFLLSGYFVYSNFSFPKERIESNMVFSLLMGMACLLHPKKANSGPVRGLPKAVLILLIPALLFCLWVGYSRYCAETHLQKALKAKTLNNQQTIIDEIALAEGPFYTSDPMNTPLLWYSGCAYFSLGNYDKAQEDFLQAYAINPYHIHVLNNLASSCEVKGEHIRAIELYKEALAISHDFPDATLNLSAAYFNAGDIEDAYETISTYQGDTSDARYKTFFKAILDARVKAAEKK